MVLFGTQLSSKITWSAAGALFGITFPIMAGLIRYWQTGYVGLTESFRSDPLLWIIATAPLFLGLFACLGGWQNDKVLEFSRNLELKVAERTQSLADATRKIEIQAQGQLILLGGLAEGVFYFGRDGNISKERSPALASILPGSETYLTIAEFFLSIAGTSSKTCAHVLDWLWNEDFFSQFEDTVAMLADEVTLQNPQGERFIRFRYGKILNPDGKLDKIIVFVADITALKEAALRQNMLIERIKRITMVVSNSEAFQLFYQDSKTLMAELDHYFLTQSEKSNTAENTKIKRDIHTLKGNVSIFEFQSLAKELNKLEDLIALKGFESVNALNLKHQWLIIKDRWHFDVKDITDILGLQKSENYLRVDINKLRKMELALKGTKIAALLEDLYRHPASEVFSKFTKLIKDLADQHGKQVKIHFTADSSDLSYDEGSHFDTALTHISRNLVDHGLETPEERLKSGKTPCCLVSFKIERTTDSMRLIVGDDGKGVDTNKLAEKALSSGLWTQAQFDHASENERINLVFVPSLSSVETVTDLSGRGIGMDAARSSLEIQGGTIKILSQRGVGTQFDLSVPYSRKTFHDLEVV